MLEVFYFALLLEGKNGRKMLGDKAQTFRRLLFSLLLARNRFPHHRKMRL